MKKIFTAALLISAALHAYAQDGTVKSLKGDAEKGIKKDASDTATKTWKKGGVFSLNVNQGSLSNWSAGGDKFSFSLNAFLNTYAYYKKARNSWDNNLDLEYGVLSTTSLGSRKAADRIDFTTKYGYAVTKKLNLAALSNVRSQFAKGYNYLKDAAGNDSAVLTSRSFAPTYLLVSLGLDVKPNADLSLFLSPITERWVFVPDDRIAPLYSIPPGKNSRNEFGAYFSATYNKKVSANSNYTGKLDLFSNYKSNPGNIDIFFTNVFTAKISKYINFSLHLDIIYDDDTKNVNPAKGPAPQIQELTGLGLVYKFKH